MNIQSNAPSYISPSIRITKGGQLHKKAGLPELRKSLVLWQRLAKTILVILPIFLLLQLTLQSLIVNVDRSIEKATMRQIVVEDQNINLLAQRARLFAPDSIEELAGKRLALFAPKKKQVGKFNRRYATFSYL